MVDLCLFSSASFNICAIAPNQHRYNVYIRRCGVIQIMNNKTSSAIPAVIRLYNSGLGYDAVAKQTALNRKTVAKILLAHGVVIRKGKDNLLGERFGALAITEYLHDDVSGKPMWRAICDCGKSTQVRSGDVKSKKIVSCGCHKNALGAIRLRRIQPAVAASRRKGYRELSGSYLSTIKNRAKNFSRTYDLDPEWLYNLYVSQNGKCALSGVDISFERPRQTASLDRIDSKRGYEKNNVRWTHKDFNLMRLDFDDKKFYLLCKTAYNYYESTKKHESISGGESRILL